MKTQVDDIPALRGVNLCRRNTASIARLHLASTTLLPMQGHRTYLKLQATLSSRTGRADNCLAYRDSEGASHSR